MRKIATKLTAAIKRIAIELVDDSAASVDMLAAHVREITQKVVWQSPRYKGGRKYLSIIESKDSEGSPFYHVQRTGRDSVAFCGFSQERPGELLCLKQWSAPYKQMVAGAYTGSLDKPEKDWIDITVEEVHEEMGVLIPRDHVLVVGGEMVGGSSDETVHLALIDITGHMVGEKNPENIYEQLAQRLWLTIDEINEQCEWKAKLIAARYLQTMGSERQDLAPKTVDRTPLVRMYTDLADNREMPEINDDEPTSEDYLTDFEMDAGGYEPDYVSIADLKALDDAQINRDTGSYFTESEITARGKEYIAAMYPKMISYQSYQDRRGAMVYLGRQDITIINDFVQQDVKDEQGYNYALKFTDEDTYLRSKGILDKFNKPGKLSFKVVRAA